MGSDVGVYLGWLQKIFGVLGSILYLIFALVMVKQVSMMSKNVNDKFNGVLIVISYLHFLAAVLLVILAWILL